MSELIPVLQALTVSNNEIRKRAEETYQNALTSNPLLVVDSLLNVCVQQGVDVNLRALSAVLLRRVFEAFLNSFAEGDILRIREQVYICWSQERTSYMSNKFAHMLAQIASDSEWPNVVQGILSSGAPPKSVLHLLEILSEYIPDDVAKAAAVYWPYLSNALASTETDIKLSAAKTAAACVAAISDEAALKIYQSVVVPILSILHEILSRGDETDATILLDRLIDVAQFKPTFFKPSFDSVIQAMIAVGNHADLEFSTRSAAMELLVTLSEAAPAIARRSKGFVEQLVDLVMKLTLEVDDDENQFKREKYNQEIDDDCIDAEDAMERLASGLGGKSVCEIVLARVQQYSAHSDWRYRRASLAALYRLAEGCTEYFAKYLPSVVSFIVSSLQDGAVRVQYEALQCIGRLARSYPDKCSRFLQDFVAYLAQILQSTGLCDRLRGHAASALINLLQPEHCEEEIVQPFLHPLLQALLSALQTARNEIRAPCLTVIGNVAQICPTAFAPYYDRIMPGVKDILQHATSKDMLALRGKAMECAGLIGEVVGVQQFAGDANAIMKIFMQAMHLEADADITFDYLLPACARMSKALGNDFAVYLPSIIQVLITGANQELQLSAEEAGEDDVAGEVVYDEETHTESTVVEVGAGVKIRMSLNTHAAQQKKQAAMLLLEFASSMGGLMGPLILPAMEALMGIMHEKFSPSDVKSNAAGGLAKLFEALLDALSSGQVSLANHGNGSVTLPHIFATCIHATAVVLKKEHDNAARMAQAECLRDLLQAVFERGTLEVDGTRRGGFPDVSLDEELTMVIVSVVLVLSAEATYRRNECLESLTGKEEVLDEEDTDQAKDSIEMEEDLLGVLVDVLGHLIKLLGEGFTKVFDEVVAPAFSSYLSPGQPAAMQAIACCLIDDALEYGGASASKYVPSVAPLLMLATQSDDTILVQSALYGLGVAAKLYPTQMLPFLAPLVSCFVSTLLRPGADEEDGAGITENAAFGLASLLTEEAYRASLTQTAQIAQDFPLGQLAKLWLKRMPLRLDGMEVQTTLAQLCTAVERNDEQLLQLGVAGGCVGDVLRVFAEVAHAVVIHSNGSIGGSNKALEAEEAKYEVVRNVHPVTLQRLRAQLQSLQQSGSAEVEKAFAQLSPAIQASVRSFLQ